jgi:tRNA-splicing ligase RtcB
MKVPGYFIATPDLAALAVQELTAWLREDSDGIPSIIQIARVATLEGLSEGSFGMADMHSGYGLTIGGVAAFDTANPKASIIPGGIGYDINCGIRLLTTDLTSDEIGGFKKRLIEAICRLVPTGVGGKSRRGTTKAEVIDIARQGARWAVSNGFGTEDDLEYCEERGCVEFADPALVSPRAIQRGLGHIGTLGSGNHFIEIQRVDRILDEFAAATMGLFQDQVVVMIHTGSRGFGYQIASDFTQEVEQKCKDKSLPDHQLAYAPFSSPLGRKYFKCMGAAVNFAFANRQVITHCVRMAFKEVLGREVEMPLLYDVAHNIAKVESHIVGGKTREFVVHRKGATRAFGPGSAEIPDKFKQIGQPVLIGGSFGTASYVLVGTQGAMRQTFGSTCHGSGRTVSRTRAGREIDGARVMRDMNSLGIDLLAASSSTIIEEAPENYKDIDAVVAACAAAGISKPVAKLLPIAVIKG